jgi:leucyl aminopeptidase
VRVEVIDDPSRLAADYPLMFAVARASMGVSRHRPCVIRLEYRGAEPIRETLLLAGKGVVYDTGGSDLKTGGSMAGMSRDKGGAAAVAGFLAVVAKLAPPGVRVIAEIGAVRNSIGADAYVADEIVTSHAGVRVRVGNTDAEGRMVLADLLSHLRQAALGAVEPRLVSIATLTGHAARAVGPYSIALDNGPARRERIAMGLASVGELWGDPFELSRVRREDFDFVRPRTKADDVLQCNNAASAVTTRGHQFPAAFLAIASGLDKHGLDAKQPLPFTHIDIAGSAVESGDWQHGRPTASPVVAMTARWLIDK